VSAVALSVATWSVHGFVGADGRRDLPRALAVLRSLDADVIALQEVDAGSGPRDAFEVLGPELGLSAFAGPTLSRSGGRYGNLLLTRYPVRHLAKLDLSQPGLEPRGAIDACLEVEGAPVRVVATHLGLRRSERALQARALCEALDLREGDAPPRILLGDLNEWRRPLAATGLAPLARRFPRRTRHRTFPARAPLFALDRVAVGGDAELHAGVVGGRRVRAASDHLAVRARVGLAA
jgi:endonuclease/exonuclease/phosphatase family metal-dependent hydrolase